MRLGDTMIPNAMTSHPSETSGARRQRGFSLIELMIAITLGLLILTGMTVVFVNTSATRNEVDRTNRQIENGRYAIELLRDDIQLAGFYGEMDAAGLPDYAGVLPDPCATALLERTWPAGGSPNILRMHVQGVNDYDSGAAAPDNLGCLTGANAVKPGTDVIVVRRVKTCIAGAADCDALTNGKPYFQVAFCGTPTVPSASTATTHALALRPEATEFVHMLNSPLGTACTVAAPLRPYVIYLYFVGTDDILKRAEFTGAAMANVSSLVDGVENMQLEYGVDTSGDGNPDVYSPSVAMPTMAVADWQNTVSVQINLLVRNTEASPDAITKTYNLGSSTAPVTITDKFRRHVYSSRVRIQNVSGRREVP